MPEGSSSRVLLFEANRLDAQLVQDQLTLAGIAAEYTTVETRDEFLQKLKNTQFDLILADYKLSCWDGMQALDMARNLNPGVPFIFVSGTMGDEAAVEAFRRGATDSIMKTRLSMLPNAVSRALREREILLQRQMALHEVNRAAEIMRTNDKLVTVGRLVGTIVHEINNPLEAVSNLIFLLGSDDTLNPAAQNYVAMARKELDRVIQITRQTLNFVRESAEPLEVSPEELLDEVLVLYARKLESKHIRVRRDLSSETKIRIMPGELRQVFANLISNAIDALPEGGTLVLRAGRARHWRDEGVPGVRVVISDSGSGISREIMEQLGQPFFTSKGHKGTGLGLWVTQRIISKYGGTLHFRSSIGGRNRGTTFSVFLPTARPVGVKPGAVTPASLPEKMLAVG